MNDQTMTPEQALRKLLATAEGNPFCPAGHLVEHGLGGADALRAALSRPAVPEGWKLVSADFVEKVRSAKRTSHPRARGILLAEAIDMLDESAEGDSK